MAMTTAWLIVTRESVRRNLDVSTARHVVLAAGFGALVGAKFYAATAATMTVRYPNMSGGGYFFGGLVGGALAYLLLMYIKGISCFRYIDSVAIAIAAGYSIGRTGCWATG